MKRTPQKIKEEKKRVFDYMHTVADLSVENTTIVWKTGIFIAVLFAVLFGASYYVSDKIIAWLTYLMPIGAYFISRINRVRKTSADIQFHQIWQNMWGIAAVTAFLTHGFKDLSMCSLFVAYYIALATGIIILYELMRIRYAATVFVTSCGFCMYGIQMALDPEMTMRWCLANFIIFDVIAFLFSGAAMRWQVKNRIKNPINFPQPKE